MKLVTLPYSLRLELRNSQGCLSPDPSSGFERRMWRWMRGLRKWRWRRKLDWSSRSPWPLLAHLSAQALEQGFAADVLGLGCPSQAPREPLVSEERILPFLWVVAKAVLVMVLASKARWARPPCHPCRCRHCHLLACLAPKAPASPSTAPECFEAPGALRSSRSRTMTSRQVYGQHRPCCAFWNQPFLLPTEEPCPRLSPWPWPEVHRHGGCPTKPVSHPPSFQDLAGHDSPHKGRDSAPR
mmetsp:Transcript_83636/g.174943  ORF Transcript_83636/g.174943 Transcript_83636/m.174943 type:complete len:241 (-) Transcript_83636:613-1335(-)